MTSSPTIRLDPLNSVLPYEMLKTAHSLIARGQNEHYWMSVPVPRRPLGRLPLEVVQQAATFVTPLVGLSWAYQHHGLQGLLYGLPVAWFTGFLLDRRLDRAIRAKARRDQKLDAGRYNALKWLSEQMGMRREEVTLDVIRKMDKDFVIVQRIIHEREAQIGAKRKAVATAVQSPHRRSHDGHVTTDSNVQAAAAAYGVEYAAAADVVFNDALTYHAPTAEFYVSNTVPSFNFASGLPMIEGTCIDIHGNMLGTNEF